MTRASSGKPSPGSVSSVTRISSPFGARSPGRTCNFANSDTTNIVAPCRSVTTTSCPVLSSRRVFGAGGSTIVNLYCSKITGRSCTCFSSSLLV
ncbi:hypothetical protein BJF90_16545 [Pseudonocardia sp. CNS-004]|nr:hypothetical protein BJF90_16545 [Pseudonocardia sp. CNS-004]